MKQISERGIAANTAMHALNNGYSIVIYDKGGSAVRVNPQGAIHKILDSKLSLFGWQMRGYIVDEEKYYAEYPGMFYDLIDDDEVDCWGCDDEDCW